MTGSGVCSVEGCDKNVQARGLCTTHYGRWRRNGTTDTVHRRTDQPYCTIPGCDRPTEASGLCLMHYSRRRRGSQIARKAEQVQGGPLIERIRRRMADPNADGCQVWLAQITGGNALPVMRYQGTTLSVRRALWAEAHPGEKLGRRWVVTSCGTPRCVAPEHLVVTTVHQFNSKEARDAVVTSR